MYIAYNDMRYSDTVSRWTNVADVHESYEEDQGGFQYTLEKTSTTCWLQRRCSVLLVGLHSTGKCSFQWREEVDLIGRQSAVDQRRWQ